MDRSTDRLTYRRPFRSFCPSHPSIYVRRATHAPTGYQQAAVLGEHLAARLKGKR